METLPIKKANALKAFNEADNAGKKILVNLFGSDIFNQKITARVKTLEDAIDVLGINPVNLKHCDLSRDELAYLKLKTIAKALNEGWEPDWNNVNQAKWYPYFDMRAGFAFSRSDCDHWYTHTTVGSRLCFKSSELAEYAGKQFSDIYKDFLTL